MKKMVISALFLIAYCRLFSFSNDLLYTYAEDDFKKGDYFNAIDLYSAYLNNAGNNIGNNTQAYYKRAIAKNITGDIDGFIADLDEAIKLNSNYSDAYYYRGIGKTKLKDFKGAINDFDVAIKLNPRDFRYYYERGVVEEENNNISDAMIDLEKSIVFESKNPYGLNPSDWTPGLE